VTTRKAFGTTLFENQGIQPRSRCFRESGSRFASCVTTPLPRTHKARLHARSLDGEGLLRELVNEVMHACLQFHGGMGFHARKVPSSAMARDARVQAIAAARPR